jgi:hypothetical protein
MSEGDQRRKPDPLMVFCLYLYGAACIGGVLVGFAERLTDGWRLALYLMLALGAIVGGSLLLTRLLNKYE